MCFQTSTRRKGNQDKEKKFKVQRQTEGQRQREGARRRVQFATYRPPADWLGCHRAAAAEALDVRSAWPPSHLQHGPWLVVKPLRDSRGREMGGGRGALCHVQARTEYLSFIDLEQRGERMTEQEDKGACASLPLVWEAERLPLPFTGVYLMYTVLFK